MAAMSMVTALTRRTLAVARRALGDLERFVAPQACPACGAPCGRAAVLCAACEARIPRLDRVLCVRCLVQEREPDGCARHARAFRAAAAWIYDERAALVVQALKFGARPALAGRLGGVVARALPRGYRADMVIEVPLHAARRRERGYDQAALLAHAVARALDAPAPPGLLVRTRATAEQSRLSAARRRHNLAGAFVVPRPGAVRGRRVLVVDDVLTTGATLEAALAALHAAGAEPHGAALAWAS
jgi:ComF family protein